MQTMLLPKGVLKEIEKLNRDFFWNQNPEMKKMHLISWETMKAEKKEGGLGIKDLICQNKAFIWKLCWGMINRPEALWVKCLRSKYKCGSESIPKIVKRSNQSVIWQAITSVWSKFYKGVGFKIRSGSNTKVWDDLWTPLDRPLREYVVRNLHLVNAESRVSDFANPAGNWDYHKWSMFLPDWVLAHIHMMQPPRGVQADTLCWRKSTDGCFSVKSAYKMIYNHKIHSGRSDWKNIWKWDIPERAKYFMWQVFHERLPTNSLRARRNVSDSPECAYECGSEESILHVLRDCEASKNVWLKLINPLYATTFFANDLQDWISWNLFNDPKGRKVERWDWSKVFALACWMIWNNRCYRAFEHNCLHPEELVRKCIHQLMEGVENGRFKHAIYRIPDRASCRWNLPPVGFIRVDVDGSVNHQHHAACGGVLRDEYGHWKGGFQTSLGFASTTEAELHAIKEGLMLCHDKGLGKVKLFTDSLEAIQLIFSDCGILHPLYQTIQDIHSLIIRSWDLEIIHCHREALVCADYIAKNGHRSRPGYLYLHEPPSYCLDAIDQDMRSCLGNVTPDFASM